MTLAQHSADGAAGDGIRADDPGPGSDDRSDDATDAGNRDLDSRHPLTVDRAALQVLKEEAERELSLRRAQASKPDGNPADNDVQPASANAPPGRRPQTSGGPASEHGRSGWGRAVLLLMPMMAALAVLLVAIYLRAPAISHTYPNAEGPLESYLEAANAFLDWLNAVLGR